MILILLSCRSLRTHDNSQIRQDEPEEPKILFLNLKIYIDNKFTNESVELINSIISEGKLKNEVNKKLELRENFILFSFLNAKREVIQLTTIDNPLNKSIEYVNEDKMLQMKKLDLKEAVFSLRMQYSNEISFIRIEKILPGLQLKHIATISLNE